MASGILREHGGDYCRGGGRVRAEPLDAAALDRAGAGAAGAARQFDDMLAAGGLAAGGAVADFAGDALLHHLLRAWLFGDILRDYVVGTLASLPPLLGYVAIGGLGGLGLSASGRDGAEIHVLLLGLGAAATLGLTVQGSRMLGRALRTV